MRKFILCICISFSIMSTCFAANSHQNFNFSYKWNLPDVAVSGFTKDKLAIDSYLTAVQKSKYSQNWNSVAQRPQDVGKDLYDKLQIFGPDDNLSVNNTGDLYLWVAVRSLQNIKITLEGSDLVANYVVTTSSPDGTITQQNKTHRIDYSLSLRDVSGVKTAIIKQGTDNKHLYTITNIIGSNDIFGSFIGQISISAAPKEFFPYSYKGTISLNIVTV